MKTVGILGGFGPESTAKFQLEIVDIFRAKKIDKRPPMLIWNTPIPLEIEMGLINNSKGVNRFLPFLIEGSERLKNGGADFIVIPCNTLHILIKELQLLVKLPIVSIIEETGRRLGVERVKTAGIIGTRLTIESNLHQNCLQTFGIKPILPSKKDQVLIDKCIDLILSNTNRSRVESSLSSIINDIKKESTNNILLACTDLKPFIKETPGIKIHDTLQILANTTAKEILSERS